MHEATMKGKPYYRCNGQRSDYADTGHPLTTAIREERILDMLDPWLSQVTGPEHRDATIDAVLAADAERPAEPANVQQARRAQAELPVELDRIISAIRAGMDPDLATAATKQIQRDLAAAHATITAYELKNTKARTLTRDEITAALDHAGSLAQMLHDSERETRARLYQALNLELNLDPVGESPTLDVRLQLCGGGGRI